MENVYDKDSNDIVYANLSENQTTKLKELEKTFNNQFQSDYYLMVMRNHNVKSWQMSGFYLYYTMLEILIG